MCCPSNAAAVLTQLGNVVRGRPQPLRWQALTAKRAGMAAAGLGNFTKAAGKGIGGPCFRIIQTHFARSRNVGDVSAKEQVSRMQAACCCRAHAPMAHWKVPPHCLAHTTGRVRHVIQHEVQQELASCCARLHWQPASTANLRTSSFGFTLCCAVCHRFGRWQHS